MQFVFQEVGQSDSLLYDFFFSPIAEGVYMLYFINLSIIIKIKEYVFICWSAHSSQSNL